MPRLTKLRLAGPGRSVAVLAVASAMVLTTALPASAASKVVWDGNATKTSWVSGRADYSTKFIVTATAPAFVARTGVRINGSVTSGGISTTVSYAKKKDPSVWCRWDQGLKNVQPIRCTNHW